MFNWGGSWHICNRMALTVLHHAHRLFKSDHSSRVSRLASTLYCCSWAGMLLKSGTLGCSALKAKSASSSSLTSAGTAPVWSDGLHQEQGVCLVQTVHVCLISVWCNAGTL